MSVEIEDAFGTPVRQHTRWLDGVLTKVSSFVRRHFHRFSKFVRCAGQLEMDFPLSTPEPGRKKKHNRLEKPNSEDQLGFDF